MRDPASGTIVATVNAPGNMLILVNKETGEIVTNPLGGGRSYVYVPLRGDECFLILLAICYLVVTLASKRRGV